MEPWQEIVTIEPEFDKFLESLPKDAREYLGKCGYNAYDEYINKHYHKHTAAVLIPSVN